MLPPRTSTPMKSRGLAMYCRLFFRNAVRAFFVAVLVGAVASVPTRVLAESSGSGSVSDDIITADVRFDAPPADTACVWEAVSGVKPVSVTVGGVTHTETLVFKACDNRIMSYHWIRNDAPRKIVDSASSRVSRVVNMLLVRSAPSFNNTVVHSPLWLWVPKSIWKPVRVTAWVATPMGPVSVTVTAKPHVLSFLPGNGDAPMRCVGPGVPWRSVRSLRSPSSDCAYTYTSPSHRRRGGTFAARVGISWNVSWTSSLGIGSPLPSITTSAPCAVRVNELQVVLR